MKESRTIKFETSDEPNDPEVLLLRIAILRSKLQEIKNCASETLGELWLSPKIKTPEYARKILIDALKEIQREALNCVQNQ